MDENRVAEFLKLFGEGVTLETSIEDLPMDSLEFLEVIQEISDKFGNISSSKVALMTTVKEIWDAIPA